MEIRRATIADLDIIVPLFDGYRQFYKQTSDLEGARAFIESRLVNDESIIYLAFVEKNAQGNYTDAVGFTQVYPIFSSVSIQRMLLLNDLFIHKDHRGLGVGTALINQVKQLCIDTKQRGVALQTEYDNPAQKLYEHLEFKKDTDLHYFWSCE